jgi:hypothetical protein
MSELTQNRTFADILLSRPMLNITHFAMAFPTHLALLAFFGATLNSKADELFSAMVLAYVIKRLVFSADGGGVLLLGCLLLNCVSVCAVVSRILTKAEYGEVDLAATQHLPMDACSEARSQDQAMV